MTAYENEVQKQPPEVFFVERCSQKFRQIHRKTPYQSLFFNKVAAVSLQL